MPALRICDMETPLHSQEALRDHRILLVDDEKSSLLLLQRILERAGYRAVTSRAHPARALAAFVERRPDLVVLDLHMPEIDGFELMDKLGSATEHGIRLPFLVVTADITDEAKRRALSMGARDFLTKPIDHTELLLRVHNLLQIQHLQMELYRRAESLELRVAERTRDLEEARLEMLDHLALAGEYRDDETQEHAWRIGRTAGLLALECECSVDEVALIGRAAPLHDIGKIGIPDSILLKPGRLTEHEFEIMKRHTTIGAEMLGGSRSLLLQLAERIALTHHERWDGGGYPAGLAGEEIPMAGRIVAVADVFDALTHERPYKAAWSIEDAVREIVNQRGKQFDPAVVDCFLTLDHPILMRRTNERHGHSGPPPWIRDAGGRAIARIGSDA